MSWSTLMVAFVVLVACAPQPLPTTIDRDSDRAELEDARGTADRAILMRQEIIEICAERAVRCDRHRKREVYRVCRRASASCDLRALLTSPIGEERPAEIDEERPTRSEGAVSLSSPAPSR